MKARAHRETPPVEHKAKGRKAAGPVVDAPPASQVPEISENVEFAALPAPVPEAASEKPRNVIARFLIPTRARVKLPYHLSYPIGAEALSDKLQKAPRREILGLFFRSRPVLASAEFQRWLRDQEPYPILVAEYRPALDEETKKTSVLEKLGLTDERLEIAVYPVAREAKSIARDLLGDLGLVHLAKWLKGATTREWANTVRRLELVFSPREGTIEVREMVMGAA